MFLFVKTSRNSIIIIDYDGDVCRMTIRDLKERVSEEWGCPVSEVRIIWAGREMVKGTIGDYGYTNAHHSITALHRPAVMAGGGQVAAEPAGDLLVDVSSDHQTPEHPPPIELPSDFHTLSEEEKVQVLMGLTASRERLREKPTNSASDSQVAASREHKPTPTEETRVIKVWSRKLQRWV